MENDGRKIPQSKALVKLGEGFGERRGASFHHFSRQESKKCSCHNFPSS